MPPIHRYPGLITLTVTTTFVILVVLSFCCLAIGSVSALDTSNNQGWVSKLIQNELSKKDKIIEKPPKPTPAVTKHPIPSPSATTTPTPQPTIMPTTPPARTNQGTINTLYGTPTPWPQVILLSPNNTASTPPPQNATIKNGGHASGDTNLTVTPSALSPTTVPPDDTTIYDPRYLAICAVLMAAIVAIIFDLIGYRMQ